MPSRITSLILLLAACTSDADDLNYGAPGVVDFGDVNPPSTQNIDDGPPIPLGLPDSYTGAVASDVTEPSDDIEMDAEPVDTSDDCANDVVVRGQILCL